MMELPEGDWPLRINDFFFISGHSAFFQRWEKIILHDMLNQCWWEENGNLISFPSFFVFPCLFFSFLKQEVWILQTEDKVVSKRVQSKNAALEATIPEWNLTSQATDVRSRATWPAHHLPLPASPQDDVTEALKNIFINQNWEEKRLELWKPSNFSNILYRSQCTRFPVRKKRLLLYFWLFVTLCKDIRKGPKTF